MSYSGNLLAACAQTNEIKHLQHNIRIRMKSDVFVACRRQRIPTAQTRAVACKPPPQLPHMPAGQKKRLQRDLVRRACKRVL